MELAIPIIGVFGLYLISKQKEGYKNKETESLPNTDIPNKNYPSEYPVMNTETDSTTKLSTVNVFDNPDVYTDKYFNPNNKSQTVQNYSGNGNKYMSLTGQEVDEKYFQHNNLVPYFGSKTHSNNAPNATESTLDNYVGSGSQHITKTERAPMFSPDENNQWAFGMPNQTDFIQSRMNPSMNQAGNKPFEPVQVGPGLGLGYTSEGVGGYNSGLLAREQWVDKNVDDLRVANKKKASGLGMLGYEGPANSYIKESATRDHIGHVEKNRVERTFDMAGELQDQEHFGDRLFTTTGTGQGQTLRAIPVERLTNRPETSAGYSGIAGTAGNIQQVRGEYMPSHMNELGETQIPGAYAGGKGISFESDYGAKSAVAYPNNRSINYSNPQKQDDYFGGAGGAGSVLGAVISPILDMLRPSRRENTIGTLRPYQNAKSTVESSYVYNPYDRPAATIRDTLESKNHLYINSGQQGNAYQNTEHQVAHNNREFTSDFYYAGNSGGIDGIRTYDAEYNQRNNDIKSSTIDGRTNSGNMALMNSNINMRGKAKESMNNRAVDGQRPYQIPSIESMGVLQGSQGLYSNTQLDRNNGDIMSQLKSNEFSIKYQG